MYQTSLLPAVCLHLSHHLGCTGRVILEAYYTLHLDLDMDARGIQLSLPPCYFPAKCFRCFTGILLTFFP